MRGAAWALAAGLALGGCSWMPSMPSLPDAGEVLDTLQWGYPVEPEALAGIADVTFVLSAAQRAAIADHVRACFPGDPVAARYLGTAMAEELAIAFDAEGVAREVASPDAALLRQRNPSGRWTFLRHAVLAVKSSRCSKLPLPDAVRGAPGQVTIRFTP